MQSRILGPLHTRTLCGGEGGNAVFPWGVDDDEGSVDEKKKKKKLPTMLMLMLMVAEEEKESGQKARNGVL